MTTTTTMTTTRATMPMFSSAHSLGSMGAVDAVDDAAFGPSQAQISGLLDIARRRCVVSLAIETPRNRAHLLAAGRLAEAWGRRGGRVRINSLLRGAGHTSPQADLHVLLGSPHATVELLGRLIAAAALAPHRTVVTADPDTLTNIAPAEATHANLAGLAGVRRDGSTWTLPSVAASLPLVATAA